MANFDETEFNRMLLAHDLKTGDIDKSTDIYVYFRDHADMSKQPPLYVLTYTINNILYPTFLIDQTLDLLNLLGQIELLRLRATKNCANILKLNILYKEEAESEGKSYRNVLLLSEDEERKIMIFDERKLTDRDVYVDLVHWISIYHIRHLLTLGNPNQVTHYLRQYYGDNPEVFLPKTIFYSSWNREERQKVAKSRDDAELLISKVYQWRTEVGLPGNIAYDDEARHRFDDSFPPVNAFPPVMQPHQLFRLISLYLKRVQGLVDALEMIFTDQ